MTHRLAKLDAEVNLLRAKGKKPPGGGLVY